MYRGKPFFNCELNQLGTRCDLELNKFLNIHSFLDQINNLLLFTGTFIQSKLALEKVYIPVINT